MVSKALRPATWISIAIAMGCAASDPPREGTPGDSGASTRDSGPEAGRPSDAASGSDAANPSDACEKMDVLFVIDNSNSMEEEQGNLVANFPEFVRVLDEYVVAGGRRLDYRIAVTSTAYDVVIRYEDDDGRNRSQAFNGLSGAFVRGAACGMSHDWIVAADMDRESQFSCLARLGTDGSPLEMPLRAMQSAFVEQVAAGPNGGFVREDALLAIVVVTDEDDCSTTEDRINTDASELSVRTGACIYPPDALIDPRSVPQVLDEVKGDRGRWAVAVVAGPGPGVCESALGEAADAERLRAFVDETGENAVFSSICEGDLSGALRRALETFDAACQRFTPLI